MTVKFRQVSTLHMKKYFFLFFLIAYLLLLGCGKDRPPTGGPKDTISPVIIDIEPAHSTTNFKGNELIITFSEPVDPKSFENAFSIYPPVLKKKIVAGNQEIKVKFYEPLQDEQSYLITIGTQLEDLHDNNLENIFTSAFSTSDSLHSSELKVNLTLHEREETRPGVYYVKLFDRSDTLFVSGQNSESLTEFDFKNLPVQGYIVRGFLDENRNAEPDKSRELFDEKEVSLTGETTNVMLVLAVQDTIKPKLRSINGQSTQKIELRFSEEIKSVGSVKILKADSRNQVEVYESLIDGPEMTCMVPPADTIRYLVELRNVTDFMGNTTTLDTMSFFNFAPPDTSDLEIDSLSHNDGQTVLTLMPEFRIRFNKLIPLDRAKIELINSESNEPIEIELSKERGFVIVVRPEKPLKNYVPYKLVVSEETMDYEGNTLKEGITISVLPLRYN